MGSCNFNDIDYNNIGTSTTVKDISKCSDVLPNVFKSYTPYTYTGNKSLISGAGLTSTQSSSGQDGSCCYIVIPTTVDGGEDLERCYDYSYNDVATNTNYILSDVSQKVLNNDGIYDGSTVKLCGISSSSGISSSGISSIASSIGGDKLDSLGEKAEKKTGVSSEGIQKLFGLVMIVLLSMIGYVIFVLGPHLFWIRLSTIEKIEICGIKFDIIQRYYNSNISSIFYDYNKSKNKCLGGKSSSKAVKESDKDSSKCIDYSINIDTAGNRGRAKAIAQDMWYNVEKLYWGFPYRFINKERETKTDSYVGHTNQGWVSVIFLFAIAALYSFFPQLVNGMKNGSVGGVGGVIAIIFMYIFALILSFYPLASKRLISAFATGDGGLKDGQELKVNYWDKLWKWPGIAICSLMIFSLGWIGMAGSGPAKIIQIIMLIFSIVYIYVVNGLTIPRKENINVDIHRAIFRMFWKGWQGQLESFRHSTVTSRRWVKGFITFVGNLPITNPIFVIFGQILFPIIDGILNILRFIGGVWGGYAGMITGKINDKDRKKYKKDWPQFLCSMFMFPPFLIGPILYAIINSIFFAFSYHLAPLLFHAKDVATIISCNLKYLVPIFGLTLLSTLWAANGNKESYLPTNILSYMTVTFVIYTIFSLFFKD